MAVDWRLGKPCEGGYLICVELPLFRSLGENVDRMRSDCIEQSWKRPKRTDRSKRAKQTSHFALQSLHAQLLDIRMRFHGAYLELCKTTPIREYCRSLAGVERPRIAVAKIQSAFRRLPKELQVEQWLVDPVSSEADGYDYEIDEESLKATCRESSVVLNLGRRLTPSLAQRAIAESLILREAEIFQDVIAAYLGYYSEFCSGWAEQIGVDVGRVPFLPNEHDRAAVQKLIQVESIHVSGSGVVVGYQLDFAIALSDDVCGLALVFEDGHLLDVSEYASSVSAGRWG